MLDMADAVARPALPLPLVVTLLGQYSDSIRIFKSQSIRKTTDRPWRGGPNNPFIGAQPPEGLYLRF